MGDRSKRKKIYCFMLGFMWRKECCPFLSLKGNFFIAILVNKQNLQFKEKHFVILKKFSLLKIGK